MKAGTNLIVAATASAKMTETSEQLQVLIMPFLISPISKNCSVLQGLDEEMESTESELTAACAPGNTSLLHSHFVPKETVDAIKILNSRKLYTVAGGVQ